MIDLIFDTETTGKWDFKARPSDEHQPHMVQLAYELVEGDRVIQTFSSFVIPMVAIPREASAIHGITDEAAREHGVKLETAVAMFMRAMQRADTIVAHNLDFDLKVLARSMWLIGKTEPLSLPKPICTMKSATPVLKLPSPHKPGSFKWPRLDESYKALVNADGFEGAHDGLVDVRACGKVLRALRTLNADLVDHNTRV
jgi:DNA polymerase III subunit epsilon